MLPPRPFRPSPSGTPDAKLGAALPVLSCSPKSREGGVFGSAALQTAFSLESSWGDGVYVGDMQVDCGALCSAPLLLLGRRGLICP